MNAQNLGFMSSWHMLTRDKGWIKPVLLLTLVGWIPILGQIVLLGYALEWARLTAWGVEAAPKQQNVDYGKVLSTGGRAFMVTLTLGAVLALLLQIVFPGSLVWLLTGNAGAVPASFAVASMGVASFLVLFVFMALSNTFVTAATLRSTIYDSFSAGWRLDRLFQMVGRDVSGFLKAYLVSLIGGVIQGAYAAVVGVLGAIVLAGGVLGAVGVAGMAGGYPDEYIIHQLLTWGAGPALLVVLCGIAAMFAGGVLSTSMVLVSVNAVGQWFARFDVKRWGLSSDPLPDGVPNVQPQGSGTMPVNPAGAVSGAAVSSGDAPVVDPVRPLDYVQSDTSSSAADTSAAHDVPEGVVLSVVTSGAGEAAAPEDGEADEAEAPVAAKKPIPLGPITSNDDGVDEEGPISV